MIMPLHFILGLWILPTILVVFIIIIRRDLTPAEYAGLLGLTFLIPLLGALSAVLYLLVILPRLRR